MAKPRAKINKGLPRGLRVRDGYYCYRSPIDGREIGLGRDRREAVQYAVTDRMVNAAVVVRYAGDARLLSAPEIIAAAKSVDTLCGVYFLIADARIVYVGQSTNVHARLADHFSKKLIRFDRFHIVPCNYMDANVLEALYIGALKPRYNVDRRASEVLSGLLYMGGERDVAGSNT